VVDELVVPVGTVVPPVVVPEGGVGAEPDEDELPLVINKGTARGPLRVVQSR
jgi:hypothetical protein